LETAQFSRSHTSSIRRVPEQLIARPILYRFCDDACVRTYPSKKIEHVPCVSSSFVEKNRGFCLLTCIDVSDDDDLAECQAHTFNDIFSGYDRL